MTKDGAGFVAEGGEIDEVAALQHGNVAWFFLGFEQ